MKLPYAERRVSERGKGRRRKGERRKERKKGSHKKEGGGRRAKKVLLYLSLPVPPYPWIPAASGEGRGTLLISGSAQRMPCCCCSLLLRSGGGSKGTTTTAPPPPKKRIHSRALLGKEKSRFRDEIGEPKKSLRSWSPSSAYFFCQPPPLPTFTLTYPGVASQKEETKETKSAFKPNRIAKQCLRKEKSFRTKVISKSVQKSPPKKANTSRYPPRHLQ